MLSFSISLLLVAAFLLLTLAVGLMSSKPTTFLKYAVDNKRLSTVKLLTTILATSFCGEIFMCSIQQCYSYGLPVITSWCSAAITLWLINLVWVRMVPFMQHLSIAGSIGSVYGKYPRIIVALLCICSSIAMVTLEINAISFIMSICISSIDPSVITILAALVLIFYATFGRIRSVTNTDVLQFITFTIIIFFIDKLMFIKTDKSFLEIISVAQTQEKFKLSGLFYPRSYLWDCVFFPLCFSIILDPIGIQRVYMCSSPIQVKKVFYIAVFLSGYNVLYMSY